MTQKRGVFMGNEVLRVAQTVIFNQKTSKLTHLRSEIQDNIRV